ncbi:MAG: ATP synthase F1 subunit epsilon [Candidatus Cloacimonetes bacterium]|nr:ATP synthase F1 subunit epsilon [Candidatus Cloacimonadota bacterium]
MLKIKVLQPTRSLLDDECDHVVIPGIDGDFSVLEGHTPFITAIRPGVMTIYKNKKTKQLFALHDGFVTVDNDVVTIVCEIAENSGEIDKNRAENAKKRAEERLQKRDPEIDFRRAELALKRAIARIETI